MNALRLTLGTVVLASALACWLFRWQVVTSSQGIFRLDRWSGAITQCVALQFNLYCGPNEIGQHIKQH